MKVSFVLNGETTSVNAPSNTRLIEVLRKDLALTGARPGCLYGTCGFCAILLDGELALACMIPVFRVSNCEVTTIEGFMETREFRDIEIGFHRAGTVPCKFCCSAKVLTTHWAITSHPTPGSEDLRRAVRAVHCRCTSYARFSNAIRYSAEVRRKRLHGRKR
ncbi:MAG: aldehyde oxidoreductase [Spirochaetaceae bacterium]|nr:MAG: aldehyde oxidoreductase [Spirochaetaceae bacterium]